MKVYVVLVLDDYEYGCRRIENIFQNEYDALKFIESTGKQRRLDLWFGSVTYYTVEEWYAN